MKRFMLNIALATAACAMISCIEENHPHIDQSTSNLVDMTLTAGTEDVESKVAFDAENYPKFTWTENDEISILGANSGNQKFTTTSAGASVIFSGKADPSDEILYAVYPYDANIKIPAEGENGTNKDAELIKITIPAVQTATAGSFDPKAYTAVAKFNAGDDKITFRGIVSFMKFRLAQPENIKSVTITAHENQTISATAGVKFDNNNVPTHGLSGTWSNGTSSVKLIESPLGDQFEKDTDYFIVTRANACPKGITISIEYDNGETYSTRSTNNQIFNKGARNHIANLGVIDAVLDKELGANCLDFSYAGYKHGEAEPSYTGYTRYDVSEYQTDGRTDREAFLAALTAALGAPVDKLDNNGNWWITFPHKESAKVEIYFPEGDWVLHTSNDDITHEGKTYSKSIVIRASDFVIKGAGRDKTRLIMNAPMQPKDPKDMYSSPDLIQLKHNSGLESLTTVIGENTAAKGSFSVNVSSTSNLLTGQWVCLYVLNKDTDFVEQEVAPYTPGADWIIKTNGVEVYDYHQIKEINGNTVTFYEPLMHEVDPKRGWEIKKFNHYENIGVEDLTFVGNAVDNFVHHQDWNHDGGYKPLSMNRVVNSWISRVDFVSVSEACSIIGSANVSAYDINMSGNRGHSAIRSQASSRVLIAETRDVTSNGAGNWHGVGVSKHSIGTVLLRNVWGNDSCFESHANQPRATLIDCCEGGWKRYHMGGNANEAPHHLADLTIWNFTATAGDTGEFLWWDEGRSDWRFLKPIIYGFQSNGITFPEDQVVIDKMHGVQVAPESLYEKQLIARGKPAPSWLKYTK